MGQLPLFLCQPIPENQGEFSQYQIVHWIKRKNPPLQFSNIREYFDTYMTKYLSQPEIDFLQGRVSANGFMRNYFNPNVIDDLKERVFKGRDEIQTKSVNPFKKLK